ncbi:hypothetical protein UlMin_027663 [Ulmus minor]
MASALLKNAILLLIAFYIVGGVNGFSFNLREKKTVRIKNAVEEGNVVKTINVRCKSKEDNLGDKVILPGQSWEFTFRPDIWKDTLFFCRIWWEKNCYYINAWVDRSDMEYGKTVCWKIMKDIPCKCDCTDGCKKELICHKRKDCPK